MLNLNSLQATRLIRQLGFTALIVALTAYTEVYFYTLFCFVRADLVQQTTNVEKCLDSGMNFFLSKPIRRSAIKHVLEIYRPCIDQEEEEASAPT